MGFVGAVWPVVVKYTAQREVLIDTGGLVEAGRRHALVRKARPPRQQERKELSYSSIALLLYT